MEALSGRQLLALSHRAKQREHGNGQFAHGVNGTADHIAAALRSFEGDPSGLAGHLAARVRGGTRLEKTPYEDGVAAVLDDVAAILANDPDTIRDIIEQGRATAHATKEA